MRAPVTALLGPTNTGKTHLALERMLERRTGMIGFPLRLLARENYDRVVAARGAQAVALVTGEERIVPPSPSFFVCTVEAMPLDRSVEFLAVDEVQLAADRERGHVFTDRILHARGTEETLLLGAETIKPLLRALVPDTAFIGRERLSTLRYTPPRKLSRLPRRSALIAFSLAELYVLAERLRRESGGVAVVFGALSPRTRNAQVGLYQGGEVDYLVATDAIGMGLNLDIDHVTFTSLSKFDGRGPRPLRPAEVAQIAGRAGRYLKDGTFGPTAELGPFDERLVAAVEGHRFDPLETLFWRSAELSFGSPAALLSSLERRPPSPHLVRAAHADDHAALSALARDPELIPLAQGAERVRLLWDVCQVPDFRNVMTDAHTRLLAQMYRHLAGPERRLPEDWVAAQVSALDRAEGDLDTLLVRIAGIRTWTYVSHRPAWLADAAYWQQRTRAVEDRLSDTLHERLTEQFVDRRAAVIARHDPGDLVASVTGEGEVLVQGLYAGRMEGFVFVPDPGLREAGRPLLAAANRALRESAPERVRAFAEEPDSAFALGPDGQIAWRGAFVARLLGGDDVLAPRVDPLASELLDPPLRERVRRRLAAWLDAHLRVALAPLFRVREASLTGSRRGLGFMLVDALGVLSRRAVAPQAGALQPGDREELAGCGVSVGRVAVWIPTLFRTDTLRLRALLWRLRHGVSAAALPAGQPQAPLDRAIPPALYAACGYLVLGPRAVRVDGLEHFAAAAHRLEREGALRPEPALGAIVEAGDADVRALLLALGYREGPRGFARGPRRPRPEPAARGR